MNQLLHTPEGVRDIYNQECEEKIVLQKRLHQRLRLYGYHDIETPTFEFFDIFQKERGSVVSREMYKFFDREGNTLVLRPDITPSIARAAAKYYMEEEMPLRFCYTGNTFINNSSYQGRLKETTQLGCELIGDSSISADAEMIAMIIHCMLEAGLTEFQVEIGEVNFFHGIAQEAGIDLETEIQLQELIERKNYFGIDELLTEKALPKERKQVFMELEDLFGENDVLKKAKILTSNQSALAAIERLEKIYQLLKIYGFENYISFELGMLGKYKYYTGVIFKAYTYGTGEVIVTGGRYDSLLQQFGKKAAAIGFAVNVDQLMMALSRQKITILSQEKACLILYEPEREEQGIELAQQYRNQAICTELLQKEEQISMEDYISYAGRNGISDIFYIKKDSFIERIAFD